MAKNWSDKPLRTVQRARNALASRVIGTRRAIREGRVAARFEELNHRRMIRPNTTENTGEGASADAAPAHPGISRITQRGTNTTPASSARTPVTSPGFINEVETPLLGWFSVNMSYVLQIEECL